MKRLRIFLAHIGQKQLLYPLVSPPLGIMYLGAYLRSRFDTDIQLVNQKLDNISDDNLVKMAADFNADIVGFSVLTTSAHTLNSLTKKCRSKLPSALIVIGGPHVSAFGPDVLEGSSADAAVAGEGEVPMEQIIHAHFECGSLEDVPGIFRKNKDGEIVKNAGETPQVKDLDTLPMPAYDLINLPSYWKHQSMPPIPRRKYASLLSSRGCPFKCIFCHRIFRKTIRKHSAERMTEEIRYLQKKYNINDIEFLDDIFNIDSSRVFEFSKLVRQKNIKTKIAFPNALRSDLLTYEIIDALIEAGMYFCSFALESGSHRIQKMIKKNLDIQLFLKNIEYAARNKVFTNGFAMLGFPTETAKDLKATIDVACKSMLHTISFFTVTPFPNTELYTYIMRTNPEKLSAIKYDDITFCGTTVNLSDVSDKEFFQYQRKANHSFYFNPNRIMRILRDFPQPYLLPLYLPIVMHRFTKGLILSKKIN